MGRYNQGEETHFLGLFAWCIAKLVAPEQKLVQQIFFLLILKLSGGSLHKKLILVLSLFLKKKNSKQALSVNLETGECGCIEA